MVLLNRIEQGEQFIQSAKLHDQHVCTRHQLTLVAVPWTFTLARAKSNIGVRYGARHRCERPQRSMWQYHLNIWLCAQGRPSAGGSSQVIIERGSQTKVSADQARYSVDDAPTKHRLLINHSRAAIVIGGGPRTLKIVRKLVALHRTVVAIEGTGGVVRHELPSNVKRADSAAAVVALVCERFVKGL
ncbi:MAG: hypothetical protein ACI8Z1_002481 [Candidatus Azotimanducaceae bacterium]|jgi:hypothetical protein